MVDTKDLKSFGESRAGSIPAPSTTFYSNNGDRKAEARLAPSRGRPIRQQANMGDRFPPRVPTKRSKIKFEYQRLRICLN